MGLIVRAELAEDSALIREVNRLAFGRDSEAELVDALRDSPSWIPELSLVALLDGEVAGHILFTRITIETAPALALAPMAVRPELQRRGIGSELVRRGLAECARLGHRIVVVAGHPAFYPRFGFTPAKPMGLEAPFPVQDAAFLVAELSPGALAGVQGMVRYPRAFDGA